MTPAERIVVILRWIVSGMILLGVLYSASPVSGQSNARWLTAWSTSQQVLGEARVTNATVRMIARVHDSR